MLSMPARLGRKTASHVVGMSAPMGVMAPTPVTTTRRLCHLCVVALVAVDVANDLNCCVARTKLGNISKRRRDLELT
jgi:hypothetical protein